MANMDMSALDAENLGLLDEDNMKLEDHDMNDTGERQDWQPLTWQSVVMHKARCHGTLYTHENTCGHDHFVHSTKLLLPQVYWRSSGNSGGKMMAPKMAWRGPTTLRR
jgi:hypothetical protein